MSNSHPDLIPGVPVRNAIISRAWLGLNDRNFLDCMITLDYGGSGQGFGGYTLLLGPKYKHYESSRTGPNYGGVFIDQVLRVSGASEWGELIGRTVRVQQDNGKVHGIGHIVKDKWFFPDAEFGRMKAAAESEGCSHENHG